MILYNGFNNQTGVCGLYIPDILTTGKNIETASISYFLFSFLFFAPRLVCVFQIFVSAAHKSRQQSFSHLQFDRFGIQLTLVLATEVNDSVSDKLYKLLLSILSRREML